MQRARSVSEPGAAVMVAALLLVGLVIAGVCGCAATRIRPPPGQDPIVTELEATGYCKCGKCCGWHRTWYGRPVHSSGPSKGKRKEVGLTASGKRVRRGTIAADTSVYPFGTIVYIEGYGYGRVEDRGGAIKGKRIDLFFPSHRRALEWGRRKVRVKVWVPEGE